MSSKKVISKLIRDKIPEFLKTKNIICNPMVLGDITYAQALDAKLQEEVVKFFEAKDGEYQLEEMADILEIIHTYLVLQGKTFEQLKVIRKVKEEERGGFIKGYLQRLNDKSTL